MNLVSAVEPSVWVYTRLQKVVDLLGDSGKGTVVLGIGLAGGSLLLPRCRVCQQVAQDGKELRQFLVVLVNFDHAVVGQVGKTA